MAAELLVLDFHGIGEVPHGVLLDEVPYWSREDVFESILDSIPHIERTSGIPIELTFDDGNASDFGIALPALVERGMTASFFVCAGRIGTPGYLDGSDMVALRTSGMRVGSHGWAHVDWRHKDDDQLGREVQDAREAISEAVGQSVDEVAIPFGSYDRRVLSWVRRAGFKTVYTSDGGRARAGGWLVPRESYTVSWTDDTLAWLAGRRVSGIPAIRRAVVRRIKRLR